MLSRLKNAFFSMSDDQVALVVAALFTGAVVATLGAKK